jgi:four helix bundle protein
MKIEKENTARFKSKRFAVRIVNLYKYLCDEKREFVLSKQLLRSGTSIGANLAEAEYGVSEKDFLAKVYISLKEAAETIYWLDILFETKFLNQDEYKSIKSDCEEILKMLKSTTKTLSQKLNPNNYTLNSNN